MIPSSSILRRKVVIDVLHLTHYQYISEIIESGELTCPIWLLVDPKYPEVRHKIWTPVLSEIQEKVYLLLHKRIDTAKIYTRYTVKDKKLIPNTLNWWSKEVVEEIGIFRELVIKYHPKVLISFGAFTFEFTRRVYDIKPEKGPIYWENAILGEEFLRAIQEFDITKTNRIPLLRRLVSETKFIEGSNFNQNCDCQNYYKYVGAKIADKIIENKDSFNIWID